MTNDQLTFFTITRLSTDKGTFVAEIAFNPAHPVFTGHFPGKPIVPGVFLLEILAAVLSRIADKEMVIKEISNIKFLEVIDPVIHPEVLLWGSISEEEYAGFKVNAVYRKGETIFAKFKSLRCC
jgi:3-hydroxyacyl-[acyl-carrier-protein] dehydratase